MFLLFVRYLHGGRRTPSELGVLSFEFLLRQAAEPSEELCAKAHCELFNLNWWDNIKLLANGNLYVSFSAIMSVFREFFAFMLRFVDERQ